MCVMLIIELFILSNNTIVEIKPNFPFGHGINLLIFSGLGLCGGTV